MRGKEAGSQCVRCAPRLGLFVAARRANEAGLLPAGACIGVEQRVDLFLGRAPVLMFVTRREAATLRAQIR